MAQHTADGNFHYVRMTKCISRHKVHMARSTVAYTESVRNEPTCGQLPP